MSSRRQQSSNQVGARQLDIGDRAVRYGGWTFSMPASFQDATPPACAGMYSVQVVNTEWMPLPFEPIYFGHSASLAARVVAVTHLAFGRWIAHPKAGMGLFVSYAALPCTSDEVLRNIVNGLVLTYRPSANLAPNGLSNRIVGYAG
jgi:hypothetical protein